MGFYWVWFGVADYFIARKKIEPHKMMTKLKLGIAFIAAGFLARLYITNVVANGITDAGNIISVGNWTLIVLVIIGMLIIGFGIADYVIAKKRG